MDVHVLPIVPSGLMDAHHENTMEDPIPPERFSIDEVLDAGLIVEVEAFSRILSDHRCSLKKCLEDWAEKQERFLRSVSVVGLDSLGQAKLAGHTQSNYEDKHGHARLSARDGTNTLFDHWQDLMSMQMNIHSSTSSQSSRDMSGYQSEVRRGVARRDVRKSNYSTGNRHIKVFLDGRFYSMIYCILVLADISVAVWEINHASNVIESPIQNPSRTKDGVSFLVCSAVLCLLFILDLVLRWLAYGQNYFIKHFPWGFLNPFIVIAFVVDLGVRYAYHEEALDTWPHITYQIALTRFVRVVHAVLYVKIMRDFVGLQDLRLMARGVYNAFFTALAASFAIFFLCLFFGLFFTRAYQHFYIQRDVSTDGEVLRAYFGTLGRSVLSLYKAMSSGQDWGELYAEIELLGDIYKIFFILFQVFAFVVLLNVVTSVFVDQTLQRSKSDRRFMTRSALMSTQEFLSTMTNIFHKIDVNGSGMIELEDLRHTLKQPKIGAYLDSLGLDTNQASSLFQLLDTDGNGRLDEHEFIFGCMRMRGEAKSLDVAIIHQQVKALQKHMIAGFSVLLGAPGNFEEMPQIPQSENDTMHRISSIGSLSSEFAL